MTLSASRARSRRCRPRAGNGVPATNSTASAGSPQMRSPEAVAPIMASFKSMDGYAEVTEEVAAIPDDSVWKASATGPLRT